MIDKYPRVIARCVDVADVITAVNFGRDQDLLIAIRGGGHNGPGLGSCGGGNFGVVTSFLFQAHPVDMVYAGPIFWEATHAQAVMRAFRDFLPTAPEEL